MFEISLNLPPSSVILSSFTVISVWLSSLRSSSLLFFVLVGFCCKIPVLLLLHASITLQAPSRRARSQVYSSPVFTSDYILGSRYYRYSLKLQKEKKKEKKTWVPLNPPRLKSKEVNSPRLHRPLVINSPNPGPTQTTPVRPHVFHLCHSRSRYLAQVSTAAQNRLRPCTIRQLLRIKLPAPSLLSNIHKRPNLLLAIETPGGGTDWGTMFLTTQLVPTTHP